MLNPKKIRMQDVLTCMQDYIEAQELEVPGRKLKKEALHFLQPFISGNTRLIWADQRLENCLGTKCLAWNQAILFLQDKVNPLGHAVACPLVAVDQAVWDVALPHKKFKIASALRDVLKLAPNTFYSAFDIMAKASMYLENRENSIVDRRNKNVYLIQNIVLGHIFRVVAFEKNQLWSMILPHLTLAE